MLGEAGGEHQRALDVLPVPQRLRLAGQRWLVLLIRDQRGVTGGGGLRVQRIVVSRALVLACGFGVASGFEQHFAEQVARRGRFRILRERVQHRAIPARRCRVVLDALTLLRLRVVVLGQILLRGLQLRGNFRRVCDGARLPERRAERVALHERLLAFEHQRGETAFLVGLDRAHLQRRRVAVVRPALRPRFERQRCVLETFLADVEIAETFVQLVCVRRIATLFQQCVDRLRTIEIGERDCHDAQRVFAELALRARERIALAQLAVREQDTIEHLEERSDALLAPELLEQRPAVLVQALLVEIARPGFDDGAVAELCVVIAARAEQDFAATELRFRVPRTLRIFRDQLIEHGQRLLGFGLRLVRARQLIHHCVVARVVGMRLQQTFVELDRLIQL